MNDAMTTSGTCGSVGAGRLRGTATGFFFGLALVAGAASGGDSATFVSYAGVPSTLKPGQKATVTVTMKNAGTTTWATTVVKETTQEVVRTTRTSFALESAGDGWGAGSAPVTGSVSPKASRSFQFQITAPKTEGSYSFQWQMCRLTVVTERPRHSSTPGTACFGAKTTKRTIIVAAKSPALVVNPKSLTIGEAGNGNFKVKLATKPTGKVTVSVASGATGAATVSPASLTFTTSNWNTTQTVTVAGVQDDDASDESVTMSLSASGGGYSNVSASVAVTVNDDDTKGLVVNPTSLSITEGKTKAFDVSLATQPTGKVTVSVTSSDGDAASASPGSLTFSTGNYSTAQTVTVTGEQDDDASDEGVTMSLSASRGGYGGVSASVAVTVNDDDTEALVVNPTSLLITEGGTGTFTVKLATKPTGNVTVSVTTGGSGAATVSPATLTFTTSNWNAAQTVTVTSAQDCDGSDGDVTISLSASGGGYDGLTASVKATVDDDDVQALVVSPKSLSITEGLEKTFTVSLATAPSDDVTVSLVSGDTGAATVKPTTVSFDKGTCGASSTVTVTAEHDKDFSDESVTISLSASGVGMSASVSVTVDDDDEEPPPDTRPKFTGSVGAQTWTKGEMISPVTLPKAKGGNGDLSYLLSCGLPDGVSHSSFTISGTPTALLGVKTCTWTVTDSDSNTKPSDTDSLRFTIRVVEPPPDPPVLVVSATSVSIDEHGNGTFTVKLSKQPTGNVTVAVTSGETGAATVTPASLTFTTSDWSTAQTVTVTGVQDADGGDESLKINLAASGADYANVSASVDVTVKDDDPRAVVVSSTKLSIDEGGTGTFTAKLSTLPTGDVTVTVSSGDTGAATASPASLTFTTSDWSTTQTVTVTGVQDADGGDESVTISLAASGADYANVSASVTAAVTDDETQAVVVSPTSLSINEGGTGTFTAKLSTLPTGDVTVSVSSGDTGAATASPASLTFTTGNYGTAQTVTVTAVQDADATDESVTISLSASGGGYANVSASATVAVTDDDTGKPTFGGKTILGKTWVKNVSVGTVTLPAATGGNGALTYSLTGTLPKGVTFSASARTLTGTPTKKQDATTYTYKATDTAGAAATLTFTIRVAKKASDGATFVSYTGVPSTMATGSSATVTVRMTNSGTTTWTTAGGYQLGSQRPADNETWGLKRVALPSSVPPNGTADFTFKIKAPSTEGSYKFSWRMLLGTAGWFGDKTTLQTIAVSKAPDTSPTFGTSTILDKTWVKNASIGTVTLPAATGGNGSLTYSLTGALPAGVTFSASARTLTGTPTKKQDATTYTYKATDTDGDAATLTFKIKVAKKASDDATFVSYSGVPSTMAAGSSATVTVRMKNSGTTTWTTAGGYQLGSGSPADNTRWGLKRVALPSSVPPNAEADFTFKITAPSKAKSYKFSWRMVLGTAGWFGAKTTQRTIAVEADTSPSFGSKTILDKTWVKNAAVAAVTLPTATGGNGSLKYTLDGTLPAGVTFNETTRTLSGTPTAKQDATTYTYKATDTDGDAATLTFTIRVAKKASDGATFVSYSGVPSKIVSGGKATVTVRMQNTGTTTWTSANYKLGSQSPADNTTWGLKRVSLSSDVLPNAIADFTFAIAAPTALGSEKFRWQMLQGVAGWFGAKTTLRTIVVEDPSFGDATVADQAWVKGTPITSVTLPAASGGTGALTYALTPALPAGVTFTEATRVLAGTPTEVKASAWYTYTATDTDGDKATISFRIEATEVPRDDAAFVSYTSVPSKMAADGTATVTVTMRNTGTTTWTSGTGYKLGSQGPADNTTWGLSRVAVPSDTAPNATADFTFAITAPGTTGGHAFSWRMVRDAATWFGASTTSETITVEDPSFGDAAVADQAWVQDAAIATLTLPAASGGDGTLTYAVTPALPAGVTFTAATRTLSGTPTGTLTGTQYAYTATDTDGDKATISFEIRVAAAPRDDATFVSSSGVPAKMAAGGTATVTVTMRNTGTTTWTSAAGYKLGSQSPADNTTWGSSRVSLASDVAPNGEVSFSISVTAPSAKGGHTFAWQMVRDPGTWFGAATTSATIMVEDPSFGSASVTNQYWSPGVAIASLTLPAASGGDGRLTYSLTPAPPAGVTFSASSRTLSGTPSTAQDEATYTYAATDRDGDKATLTFSIAVGGASAWSESSTAPPSSPPSDADAERARAIEGGVFDAFEYWLLPAGSAVKVRTRLGDGREAPAAGSAWLRSFWRGDLWGRKVALLGDPDGGRYDIFEEVADGLDYWGTYEGVSPAGGEARPSVSLDRPFRWMNRSMQVGDAVEGPVTGRLLSDRRRNQDGVLEATMRLEVLSHRESFTIPGAPSGASGASGVSGASGAPGDPGAAGPTFEDVLEVRFWPDVRQADAHDTFYLARGYGAVYSRRSGVSAPGEVAEWWAVEKALTPVVPAPPSVPWFDPFSGAWPKTAVVNGNLDDVGPGFEGGPVRRSEFPESSWLPESSGTPGTSGTSGTSGTLGAPGWRADSGDAAVARPPAGLDAGPWGLLLRGSDGGGDEAPDAAVSEEWIPVDGGTYRLSACMLRENVRDDVFVDFDDGRGRDADFTDAHLVAASTGTWECRAVTKCIPASVGAIKVRAARGGANLGDAWFDRIELKRIAACAERPGMTR